MKYIFYILCTIGVAQHAFAQDELQRADNYFAREYYTDAIPLYEQLLATQKNAKLVRNLADSYYNTFDMNAAARWYGYLVKNYGSTTDENPNRSLSSSFKSLGETGMVHIGESYYQKFAQSLKAIGKMEEAHQVLVDFYTLRGDSAKVEQLREHFNYLNNVRAIGDRFDIENLALNTVYSEFGAARVDSNLIYSASRKVPSTLSKVYRWNNQNYLDLYAQPIDKINMGDSLSVALPGAVNSKMHEAVFAVTKDRKTLYFTRNSKQRDDSKVSNLKIYRAEWVNGAWKNIQVLPFNGNDFSSEHPALNADETQLYFASDREGGFGGFDIYSVTIGKDGFYGNPKNLGKEINTSKKEQFPFLDGDNNLYFASNGHRGFGLLDVFIAKRSNSGFERPDNLGLPINSGYDDFSLWMDSDGKTGYFSSNRPTGKGSDDIYSFSETKPLLIENCKQFIAGTLIDLTTGMPLANGKVALLDAEGNTIETITTKQDAAFQFQVACSTAYRVEAKKGGYEPNAKSVRTDEGRNAIKDGSLTLYSVEERERQNALALELEQKEIEKRTVAEAEKKMAAEKAAEKMRVLKEKESIAREEEMQQIAEKKRLQNIEDTIQSEEALVKKDEKIIIETEEIHFDYSLWYLRRESRERLAKVIEIMKNNPGIVLEIGTHTDIRGNEEYNRDLSQKRADSAKEFLVKSGIGTERIIAKGYGESQPIVECASEESCSEEDHEWNRRCELVVVAWN